MCDDRAGKFETILMARGRTCWASADSDRRDELQKSANPFARFVVAHLKTLETQGDYETRLAWKLRLILGLYYMNVSEGEIGQLYHDFD